MNFLNNISILYKYLKSLIAKESDRLKELRKILNLGENIYGFEKVRKAKDEKLDEHILDLWAEKYLNSGEVLYQLPKEKLCLDSSQPILT